MSVVSNKRTWITMFVMIRIYVMKYKRRVTFSIKLKKFKDYKLHLEKSTAKIKRGT